VSCTFDKTSEALAPENKTEIGEVTRNIETVENEEVISINYV
jgi:hypothetical protein